MTPSSSIDTSGAVSSTIDDRRYDLNSFLSAPPAPRRPILSHQNRIDQQQVVHRDGKLQLPCLENNLTIFTPRLVVPLTGITIRDRPVTENRTNIMELLLRLDDIAAPGIPAPQFSSLFVACKCGLVTTERAFTFHTCLPPQVIDLTEDSGDNGMVIDLAD